MTHSLLSRSVISLIALAPLALVSNASAIYINRHATSGVMSMSGRWYGIVPDNDPPLFWDTDSATGTIPAEWENGSIGWAVEQSPYSGHPRLVGNAWQDTGVSAWSRGGSLHTTSQGVVYDIDEPISWSVPSLEMTFAVDIADLLEIRTQTYGSFSANFQSQNSAGAWISLGTWSDLGATKVFNVVAGSNYRFQLTASAVLAPNDSIFEMHLTGSGAPAPGALALIGMAGIFGGRRRRSGSRMDAQ